MVERIPPERLIIPAVNPLVMKAKPPFTRVMRRACGKPKLPAANIVMMFENPGFAPGGRKGSGGIRLSRKPRANA